MGRPEKRKLLEDGDAVPAKVLKAVPKEESKPVVKIRVTIDCVQQEVTEWTTFQEAALPEKLEALCLSKFATPTQIQGIAWPLLMKQMDMIGVAKTGSGKTLAFLMPFLALSEAKSIPKRKVAWAPRCVTLAPTRELALQIAAVAEEFAAPFSRKGSPKYPVVTLLGGVPKKEQRDALAAGCDIAVCTPGRLQDLAEEGAIDLGQTQVLVLDEADRMLDMGFIDSVRKLVRQMPDRATRQTVLFSATWPPSVEALAAELTKQKGLAHVTVGRSGERPKANESINQEVEMVGQKAKWNRLMQIMKETTSKKTIIFGLYKKEVSWITTALKGQGYNVGSLHGDMSQAARMDSIDRFKSNKFPLLVATDVAGRGLDVEDVQLVVNYTFPLTIEDYVHRIGRTGRAGKTGKSITFFDEHGGCGAQKESELAEALMNIMKEAKQTVPPALTELAGSSTGSKAIKKKAHSLYGNHFKDAAEMKKLEANKVHTTFADSDDE